jgi:hypothetical protein
MRACFASETSGGAMPNYCPFCAAPLAPTGDAFCGECRGQLDEAPPPGSTPADIEVRRKISTGVSGELTPVDLMICIFLPLIGLIVGAMRQGRGQPSGTRMLQISGVSMALRIGLWFLFSLLR